MDQLATFGEVRRGTLGISVQDLTGDLAGAFNVESGKGVLVAEVAKESDAGRAGLRAGDVIISIGEYEVSSAQEFHNYEGQFPVDEKVTLVIVRDQSEKKIRIKVEELKALDGGTVDPRLTGATFEELPLKQNTVMLQGVILSKLEADSNLARRGMRPGDVVTGVSRIKIRDLGEFEEAVSSAEGRLFLEIVRNGNNYVVRVD
jgi:serine protease Do/serine protease DegQ